MSGTEKLTRGWIRAAEDADLTLELPNGGGPMFFRRIPAGSFRMGSRYGEPAEQPAHWVRIPEPFYMGVFPVTQRQFSEFLREQGTEPEYAFTHPDPDGFPAALRPAENMNWQGARAFGTWLRSLPDVPEGFQPGLPPESYWEYACRGTREWAGDMEYGNGDGEAVLDAMGWYRENSATQTHAVGGKHPNGFGLYDMHGNVWEWCQDSWQPDSPRLLNDAYRWRIDGEAAPVLTGDSSARRVLRGGSWCNPAWWCRSAVRNGGHPGVRGRIQGFRPCLLPGPVPRQGERGALQQAGAEAKEGAGEGGGTPTGRAPTAAGARGAKNPLDDLILPQRPSDDPSEGR